MCGIAGIYNSTENLEKLQSLACSLTDMLKHRGPDGNGYKVLDQQNNRRTMFAHTRLSIIDLTDNAAQPMTDSIGRFFITYNGEIYNHLELRQELENLGSVFRTDSDTEVIIESYKQWGLEGFKRFIGMWALAIWDSVNEELILSRDRLGIKPLFFSEKDGAVAFGSEPKVVLESLGMKPRLNVNAISDYFGYRYVLGGDSFFEGIKSLEAGTHLVCKNGKIEKITYWTLPIVKEKKDHSEVELQEELRSLLRSSVSYRMISDVPFGSFLSGGLDSSILVSEMSKIQENPIKTFTIGFKEKGFNEFEYAKAVSEHLETNHTETELDADSYLEAMLKMIAIKDAPLAVPNEIALHKMSLVLKRDITVVLSGEGADELFGGYGRIFRSAYDYERMAAGLSMPNVLKENLALKYETLETGSELDHFLKQYSYVSDKEKQSLFSPLILESLKGDLDNRNFFEPLWQNLEGLSLSEKIIWIFQKVHLEGLLGRLDSSTMSASVEGRVPFVDHRLVEFFNNVPIEFKMRWRSQAHMKEAEMLNSDQISEVYDTTKYILRETYKKDLPEIISARKKVGFPVPLQEWLAGSLKGYAKERLLDSKSKTSEVFNSEEVKVSLENAGSNTRSGLKVWMMLNAEEWMRQYNVDI